MLLSRNSSEAAYCELASTTCEPQWLTFLLADFHVIFLVEHCYDVITNLLQIASNQYFHEHSKHINIDCRIVRDKVAAVLIKFLPISSSLQLADVLSCFKIFVPSWDCLIFIPSLRETLNYSFLLFFLLDICYRSVIFFSFRYSTLYIYTFYYLTVT